VLISGVDNGEQVVLRPDGREQAAAKWGSKFKFSINNIILCAQQILKY